MILTMVINTVFSVNINKAERLIESIIMFLFIYAKLNINMKLIKNIRVNIPALAVMLIISLIGFILKDSYISKK